MINTITYVTSLTSQQAKQMATITQTVEQLEDKTEQQILDNSAKLGSVLAMDGDQIVGCVGLMKYDIEGQILYERGSLRVDPAYRGHRISTNLILQLIQHHSEKTLLCLTKEDAVHYICTKHLQWDHYQGDHVQGTPLGDALESNGDTIEKYTIYADATASKLFSLIVTV